MKGPKCRLCGKEHFSNEPHRWEEEPVESQGYLEPDAVRPRQSVHEKKVEPDIQESGQVAANRRWREKDPERYKKYQREYMRSRRKK